MLEQIHPICSSKPRTTGVRRRARPAAARWAMCSARSPLRSSSGTTRSTETRKRMSPAIGVWVRSSCSVSSSSSASSWSTRQSFSVSWRAASVSPSSSVSVAAVTLSVTSANRRTTCTSISSRCWWKRRRSSLGASDTEARYPPSTTRSRRDQAGRPLVVAASGSGAGVGGVGLEGLVVDLAVRGAADGLYPEHVLRRLVVGELGPHVGDQLVGGDVLVVRGLHHGRHHLAELLVVHAHGHRVPHPRVGLEDLLDLLGEDLLAPGVDDHRAPAQQGEVAVRLDHGAVAGAGVALALELDERGRGLLGVLVVADGLEAADGHPPDLTRAGLDPPPVLGDDDGVLAQLERGRGAGVGAR